MDMVYDNNDNKEKVIRGKALYFGTSQVADMLNISASKTRYYTDVFDDILHIEISNKQRRYTQVDVDKMKFMIELKEDGMTIKQIQEYCQEVDFENSQEIQIKENNPLGIQAIAKALLEQQAILIAEMKRDIIDTVVDEVNRSLSEQNNKFNIMKNTLNSDIAITVEDTVNSKLGNFMENIQQELSLTKEANQKQLESQSQQMQTNLDNMSNKIIEENTKALSESVNEFKCITLEQLKNQQPKSFIDRIFHLKK